MVNRRTGKPGVRDKSRGSGFVYKPRDKEEVKKRADRPRGRFDSPFKGDFQSFRPKAGDNVVRILPPTWEDHEHFGLAVHVHSYVGPDQSTYLCLRKMKNTHCPICDAAKAARDQGDTDEAKALQVNERVLYWILDRESDTPDQPIPWMVSWTMDQDITKRTIDKRRDAVRLVDHPDKGYDLLFSRTGQGLNTRYQALEFDREQSPIHDDPDKQEDILNFISENPLPDILNYYEADYLEGVMAGTAGADKRDEADEDEDEKPKRTRGRGKVADDEEEEERPSRRRSRGDEEEEEEKPKRSSSTTQEGRGSRRKKDEDDEDEDEEEEKPARGRKRPADDEDEEEDERPKRTTKRSVADDEDEEEDEEEERPTKTRGKTPTTRRGKPDEDDEDEDEEEERPSRGKSAKSARSDDDEDEEDERPTRGKSSRAASSDDEDEDEDPPTSRRSSKRRGDEDEDEEDDEDERPASRRTKSEVRSPSTGKTESRRVGSGRKQYRD